jgi:hypothetical protein
MPTLSRWFIKIGMIYFTIGLMMMALLMVQPVLAWSSNLQVLRPVAFHFLVIGWITQLIMGVGYWMFPKQSKDTPRGSERIGWAVLILLNIGLILRAIGEPAVVLMPDAKIGRTLAVASLCLLLAGWGFIANSWGRIKER